MFSLSFFFFIIIIMNSNIQPSTVTMKELIKLQNESSAKVIKEYCQNAQYQNMVMNKLKYQRDLYV